MSGWFGNRGLDHHRLEAFHLAVLSSFAVAQPLFNLISGSPEFLVAHRVEPGGLILLVALVLLGPPTVLLLLVRLAGASHSPARRLGMGLAVAGLTSAFWLPALKRLPALPGSLLLVLALLIGVGAGVGHIRFRPVRIFVSFLSPGLLLFPSLSLVQSPVHKLLFPALPDGRTAAEVRSRTPVVVVIFDQLPLTSLLDPGGKIDSDLYPHFAKLAGEAVWFRNATTVSDRTSYALPAILSGNYPRPSSLPTAADHPGNLFDFLAHYHLKAYEPITRLCRPGLCRPFRRALAARLRTLLVDLSIAYYHILAPAEFAHLAPPIDQKWKNFAGESPDSSGSRWVRERDQDRRQGPLGFIASIQAEDPQPALYFLHVLLPHEPFQLLPSGRYYGHSQNVTGLLSGERWTNEHLAVELNYLRHLLQVRYVDRLLGKLLDRLRDTGLYDRSLLLVTSAHGASFRPGDLFKEPSNTNFADIMSVPLLIKLPGQREGRIDASNVETIDVFPTIADALGSPLTWPTDGQSALRVQAVSRIAKTIFFSGATRSWQGSPEAIDSQLQSALTNKQLLGKGTSQWSWSPVFPELIGREAALLDSGGDARIRAQLHYSDLLEEVNPGGGYIPSLLSGHLELEGKERIDLAVSVNGQIRATTRTYGFPVLGRHSGAWEALVPENVFTAGKNLVEVFTIRGSRDHPILSRLYSSQYEVPAHENLILEVARWRQGIEFSGLYPQGWWGDRPGRWTNGNASLAIRLDPARPPRHLELRLLHTGPRGTSLKILANSCRLFENPTRPGRLTLTLDLSDCPLDTGLLKIELISSTFVPRDIDPSSNDVRVLGIAVESLTLLE